MHVDGGWSEWGGGLFICVLVGRTEGRKRTKKGSNNGGGHIRGFSSLLVFLRYSYVHKLLLCCYCIPTERKNNTIHSSAPLSLTHWHPSPRLTTTASLHHHVCTPSTHLPPPLSTNATQALIASTCASACAAWNAGRAASAASTRTSVGKGARSTSKRRALYSCGISAASASVMALPTQ